MGIIIIVISDDLNSSGVLSTTKMSSCRKHSIMGSQVKSSLIDNSLIIIIIKYKKIEIIIMTDD